MGSPYGYNPDYSSPYFSILVTNYVRFMHSRPAIIDAGARCRRGDNGKPRR